MKAIVLVTFFLKKKKTNKLTNKQKCALKVFEYSSLYTGIKDDSDKGDF